MSIAAEHAEVMHKVEAMQLSCGCCSLQVPAPAQPSGHCPSWLWAAVLLPAAAVTACPREKHPPGWFPIAEEEGSSHLPQLQPCTQPVPHTLTSKPLLYPESNRGKTAGTWSPFQGSTLDLPTLTWLLFTAPYGFWEAAVPWGTACLLATPSQL